ncbi:hypothetical protein BCR35DRAFT_219067 [Leucosporidium creatinivorum]|uniref:Uncharacterized protein n=1 Tax=Leucosporidium creatinivorum TaxID=106004 RepID=A0A1Y2FX30_9BASI|nr:hypothetical protein BCR35DRAFT_219067 [Leucosporidium creatinivorum]
MLFPDQDHFLRLNAVRPHWEVDARRRQVVDEVAWETALPNIKADIEEAKHVNRVRHFHQLLKTLRQARVPIDNLDDLFERSTLPTSCIETDITPEEMEPILSLYVAQTLCTDEGCFSTHSLFDTFSHEDLKHGGSTSNSHLLYK